MFQKRFFIHLVAGESLTRGCKWVIKIPPFTNVFAAFAGESVKIKVYQIS